MDNFNQALNALKSGEVIAYPTEGVFGVGCDPDNADAIKKLLALKQRPVEKGLILIAANYEQLLPYIDESQLTPQQLEKIHQSWPGLLPGSCRAATKSLIGSAGSLIRLRCVLPIIL